MAKYRQGRINEAMVKEISDIIRGVKDPRVSDLLVTITGVDCSADLKFAKIYYSAVTDEPAEVEKGLVSASGYIRSQIAERLNLRITPELKFIHDKSIEKGAQIAKLLKQVEGDLGDREDN